MALIKDENNIWVSQLNDSSLSYPTSDYDIAYNIEDKSFWFNYRNEAIFNIIQRFPFKGNFADIGGGNGFQAKFLSEKLNDKIVFLVEPAYSGCLNAKKRGLNNIFNILFNQFPFRDKEVGGVGLFDVLEHLEDDVAFLNEMKSCLKSGDYIYITVPAYNFLWSDVDDYSQHFRRYSGKMIIKLSEATNTELIYNGSIFSFLLPFTFIFRSIAYRIFGKKSDDKIINQAINNHSSLSLLDNIFNFFGKIELFLIKRVTIPFGASRLAILKVK
jgi:SAM-dependent methyltransferase